MIAGLALLTACGGATATGDPAQTTDCAANPFGASCIAEDIALPARLADCIAGGNAGQDRCASLTSDAAINTAINTCLTNPFDDSCTASDFTFSTYAEMARTNRASFCGIAGNETDALCPTVVRTCIADPFGAECGTYFEFAEESYCEANDATGCPNATSADWVASFTTAPLATTPTTGTPKNEFLQTTGGTLPTGALTANGGGAITVDSLTLNANDGVAFFQGYSGNNNAFYAGIFETTDLGAPFTNAVAPSAKWRGQFQAIGTFSVNSDFMLEVSFGGTGDIAGSVEAFVQQEGSSYYLLAGNFNRQGVIISGTTRLAIFSNGDRNSIGDATLDGILTGLIGAEGAVGVFISNANAYAGGFIAAPTALDTEPLVVNHGDWLREFFKPPPATRAASSAGTDTFGGFLNLASDVRAISETGFGAPTVTKGILTLDGDGTDGMHGVVYLGGANATNNNRQAFVAVLPTTNLGAPLVSPPTTTTWPGKYHNLTFGNAQEIPFVIDFSGKSITATHIDDTTASTDFDLKFNRVGVITGTVTRGTTATAQGLIGTNGLVGVFVDTRTGRPAGDSVLFGGFIADNPDN